MLGAMGVMTRHRIPHPTQDANMSVQESPRRGGVDACNTAGRTPSDGESGDDGPRLDLDCVYQKPRLPHVLSLERLDCHCCMRHGYWGAHAACGQYAWSLACAACWSC